MAENPSVTVSVLADIRALEAGMTRAEQTVSRASTTMAQSIERADLGGRFNKAASGFSKAALGISESLRVIGQETATTMQKVDGLVQGLSMMGGKFGMVAGASYSAGRALYDFLAGTQALEKADAERVSNLQRTQAMQQETEILQKQLEILRETDPFRKMHLQHQLDMLRLNRERLSTVGGPAADAMFGVREQIIGEQSAQAIDKLTDQENERKKAIKEQLEDRNAELKILKETDPIRKAELEYDLKKAQILREVNELRARGASLDEIRLASLKDDVALEEKKQKIAALTPTQEAAAATTTIQTRLGGSFTFAENNIMRGIQQFAQQQVMLQTNLLNGMAEIIAIIKNKGYVIT